MGITLFGLYFTEKNYSGEMTHKSPELILELNLRDGHTYTLLPSVRAEDNQTCADYTESLRRERARYEW